jgi:hypothetical protein
MMKEEEYREFWNMSATSTVSQDEVLKLAELPEGTIIRIGTSSGNCYLAILMEPGTSLAYLIRRDPRNYRGDMIKGPLGNQHLSPEIVIGETFIHDGIETRIVSSIEIVFEPSLRKTA